MLLPQDRRPTAFVFNCSADRDVAALLAPFANLFAKYVLRFGAASLLLHVARLMVVCWTQINLSMQVSL